MFLSNRLNLTHQPERGTLDLEDQVGLPLGEDTRSPRIPHPAGRLLGGDPGCIKVAADLDQKGRERGIVSLLAPRVLARLSDATISIRALFPR